jgi:hypothetical protein
MVAMSEHYKNIRYKEIKVNIAFVSNENQVGKFYTDSVLFLIEEVPKVII